MFLFFSSTQTTQLRILLHTPHCTYVDKSLLGSSTRSGIVGLYVLCIFSFIHNIKSLSQFTRTDKSCCGLPNTPGSRSSMYFNCFIGPHSLHQSLFPAWHVASNNPTFQQLNITPQSQEAPKKFPIPHP